MRSLLDVNVLISLLDAGHSMHSQSTRWYSRHARKGWASCPLTQNGCLRIMSHSSYPGALTISHIAQRLAEATANRHHEFWPDDISLLDPDVVDHSKIHGPRQLTDVYLLALAHHNGGRFVTFDRSISLATVRGATAEHLVVL